MHHKFCVIDNEVVITGSYNWTASADKRNNENLLVIHDAKIAQEYSAEFNRLWNIGKYRKIGTAPIIVDRLSRCT